MREEVEGDTLRTEDRMKRTLHACDYIPGRDPVPLDFLGGPSKLGVELPKCCLSER